MAGKIYLFTGESQYKVFQEVQRRKRNFADKFGVDSVLEYRGDWDPVEVASALQGGGLFSTQKLVIIRGIPQDTIASNKVNVGQINSVFPILESKIEHAPEQDNVLVVCVSYKPDKRKREFKWFTKNAEVKEYKPLKGAQLKKYVTQISQRDANSVEHFIALTGTDLWYIHHCVDIVHSWQEATGEAISPQMIDLLVYPRTQANNFAFMDVMFVDATRAIRHLDEAKDDGTNWNMFLGAVYRGLKIIIQMSVLYNQGMTTSSALAKEVGGPPFTISRYMKFMDVLSGKHKQMFEFRDSVVVLDVGIKTGKIPDNSFWLQMKRIVMKFHS